MARKNEFKMQFGVLSQGKWTGEWRPACGEYVASTVQQLRAPSHYWVISDAQLKRDLQGRSLKDIYRENKAGRVVATPAYVPQWFDGIHTHGGLQASHVGDTIRERYLAECMARNHTPHLASLDSDHPHNCHRLKAPKRELQAANEHPYHLAMAA